MISVHPHACGELGVSALKQFHIGGSSPRMWGTQPPSPLRVRGQRFIPTHVGNSSMSSVNAVIMTVHPHACGELLRPLPFSVFKIGSSPRMWGTLRGPRLLIRGDRFIPTHVGNSAPSPTARRRKPVHPHACGELLRREAHIILGRGSSPRMWGTQGHGDWCGGGGRFIPTHVGNSSCLATCGHIYPVHPHACGELATPQTRRRS